MANKYSFKFTDLAINDIETALNYISVNLMNRKSASELLSYIEKTIENICIFPYSYPDCSYYFIRDNTIRHTNIKNYILVYRINEETSSIELLRFKYSKQKEIL
ncbi:MAG: type II toxin-antitoxin system RelE/ParE family toxin [Anaeroplasmataceae bacterium]|nr:type II toxin-antitoxin system RelE/ParE family toxin [Anaeroplasmataceae bacterium]